MPEYQDQLDIHSVDGTDIHLRIAGVGGRSFAFAIDWHIKTLVAAAWFISGWLIMGASAEADWIGETSALAFWLILIPPVLIYVFYHPVLELVMHGRTPGKRYAGIRITTLDGLRPGVGPLLIRNIFRLVDSLPVFYLLGILVAIFTKRQVRIGDLAAGTLLIYDDGRNPGGDLLVSEDYDQARAELEDLAGDLVKRWRQLDPERRRALGFRLLERFDFAIDESQTDQELRETLKTLANL